MPSFMQPKLRVGLVAFVVCLSLDLVSKYLVEAHLHFGDRREVIEGFFYLTHVRNPGAAFGLFATARPSWRTHVVSPRRSGRTVASLPQSCVSCGRRPLIGCATDDPEA